MAAATLVRERKFAPDAIEPDGTFSGYASLFGAADLSKDVIERGAFAASLKARGTANVRMLFQHDPAEPIGAWTELREDASGLFARGKPNLEVSRARELLALMRGGGLDGLSIGFRTVRARRDAGGLRRVIEADLWEISVVTFPMQPLARVRSVKSGLAGRMKAVAARFLLPVNGERFAGRVAFASLEAARKI